MKTYAALASAVANLPTVSLTGNVWYRVINTRYLPSAINTAHTRVTPSRFYDPHSTNPQFRTLYLSDDPVVAQFEAQVLLGSSITVNVPNPRTRAWVVLAVNVSLAGNSIVDLSDAACQGKLDSSAQELTGDWQGYRGRSSSTNVTAPVGAAPTQDLGKAIHRDGRDLEGFYAVSAKVPSNRNLIVFPDHLGPMSYVEYEWDDAGTLRRYRIDRANPDGQLL